MNAKKRALGKGLSALLDSQDSSRQGHYQAGQEIPAVGTIGRVALDLIESNPYQPRTDFNEESLMELAASIKEQGVIQPVTLRKTSDGSLQLISGERRCKASRLAGLADIPAYIIAASDHGMLEMAIVENIQRENLNPMEIALGYQQLIKEYQLTQEMLSERLGKSRSSIANHLRLLKLPGEIQIGLRQDLISMGHARALAGLSQPQVQLEIYQDILAQSLSVRDVEDIVNNLSQPTEATEKLTPEKGEKAGRRLFEEEEVDHLQKELSYIYDSKVKLKTLAGGKGQIVIQFSSRNDLERLLSLLKK